MSDSAILSEEVLARRATLPVKMDPVVLTGNRVVLKPLDVQRDGKTLYAISNGAPIERDGIKIEAYDAERVVWQYMLGGPFHDYAGFEKHLLLQMNSANGLAMCVFDERSDKQVGVATYMNNVPEHLKVELGSIWYSPLAQGRGYNFEATYLMLEHAFSLGYRRVEWKCNALNERSRKAALRMGFEFEGIQDSHFIIKGKNRDTAWYRMLDREWPSRKLQLEKLIAR